IYILYSISFFFTSSVAHLSLPSFPTRRSSDLHLHVPLTVVKVVISDLIERGYCPAPEIRSQYRASESRISSAVLRHTNGFGLWRSEEHTSELQSRSDLVCRLLLEKKKKTRIII